MLVHTHIKSQTVAQVKAPLHADRWAKRSSIKVENVLPPRRPSCARSLFCFWAISLCRSVEMYPSQTCSTNTFSGSYMHQISLYEISLLEGVIAVFAKAASTKPQRKKVSEGATGSRRARRREGVCQRAFICGMVMTLFLQALSKLSASCLLRARSHICPWKQSTCNELQPFLKSCQETREGWLEERRWGGGIWSCAERDKQKDRKNRSEAPEPLMWAGAESTAPYSAGGAGVSLSDSNKVNTDIWLELKEYYCLLIRQRG